MIPEALKLITAHLVNPKASDFLILNQQVEHQRRQQATKEKGPYCRSVHCKWQWCANLSSSTSTGECHASVPISTLRGLLRMSKLYSAIGRDLRHLGTKTALPVYQVLSIYQQQQQPTLAQGTPSALPRFGAEILMECNP